MSSLIHSCYYAPPNKQSYTPIHSLTTLQCGAFNISSLTREIVENDFGYTGTDKYTLTLKCDRVVLDIFHGESELQKTTFTLTRDNERQWTLLKDSSNTAMLKNSDQISNRVNHTLKRVGQAYIEANPESIPPLFESTSEESAKLEIPSQPTTSSTVNNYITNNYPQEMTTLEPRVSFLELSLQQQQNFSKKLLKALEHLGKQIVELNPKMEEKQRSEVIIQTPFAKLEIPNEFYKQLSCLQEQIKLLSQQMQKMQLHLMMPKPQPTEIRKLEPVSAQRREIDTPPQAATATINLLTKHKTTKLKATRGPLQQVPLQSLLNVIQNMGSSIDPEYAASLLHNLVLLENFNGTDKKEWIQSKLLDVDQLKLSRLTKSLIVHQFSPQKITSGLSEINVEELSGMLSKALNSQTIQYVQNTDNFSTIEKCFGSKLCIVKQLLDAKNQIEPLCKEYRKRQDNKVTEAQKSRKAKFKKAEELVKQIDDTINALKNALTNKTWNLKKPSKQN